MARHQQLVDRVAAGEIPPAVVQEQGRRFLEEHAPELLGDVMTLGLTFVSQLQQSSSAMADGLYDRVLGPDMDRATRPEPPICVDLRGPSGSVQSAGVVVENTRLQSADVVCTASEFAPRSGGQRFRPALEIAPSRFRLAPGEQRDVDIRLLLDPARFATGSDYVATLSIEGAGERPLIVQLIARVESPSLPTEATPADVAAQPVVARPAPRPRSAKASRKRKSA
jgi:hypothetical protein